MIDELLWVLLGVDLGLFAVICVSMVDYVFDKLNEKNALNQELLEALELALFAHGKMLLSDPPQEAWKTYEVESKARAAIAKAQGASNE